MDSPGLLGSDGDCCSSPSGWVSSATCWLTGAGTGEELTTLTGVGFGLIEVPAMLLMVPAVVSYGLGLLRDRVLPRWSAWSLVCGGILALPGSLIVITLRAALISHHNAGRDRRSPDRIRHR